MLGHEIVWRPHQEIVETALQCEATELHIRVQCTTIIPGEGPHVRLFSFVLQKPNMLQAFLKPSVIELYCASVKCCIRTVDQSLAQPLVQYYRALFIYSYPHADTIRD
jgi:hypothetical protein